MSERDEIWWLGFSEAAAKALNLKRHEAQALAFIVRTAPAVAHHVSFPKRSEAENRRMGGHAAVAVCTLRPALADVGLDVHVETVHQRWGQRGGYRMTQADADRVIDFVASWTCGCTPSAESEAA